uniref:ATP synthase F0 subunit 6 n=1 Tax=Nisia atrovenosa TaxID=1187023 RepID=UPI002A811526|nr:ATP synthase F0 subunit 6 [Nisia atrovenosa]WOW98922.1 ATP synthase F0 subunit 6 [Nisia atrovenosa]
MMTNLFSPFDPCSSSSSLIQLNWMSIFMIMLMIQKNMFMKNNRWFMIFILIKKKLINEFKSIIINKQPILKTISLFFFIILMNITSLFPFTFTPTGHILISASLAIPIWLMNISFMITNKKIKLLSHMIPSGTPSILMPFMVIIETIGLMIRPLSLSVRLSANLIAGHLIMILINSNKLSIISMLILYIQLLMMTFELAISTIQAYVFSTISMLYSSES